jgi:hypothetical protein
MKEKGRPRRVEGERSTELLGFFVTPEEKDLILGNAKAKGFSSLSAFLRFATLQSPAGRKS